MPNTSDMINARFCTYCVYYNLTAIEMPCRDCLLRRDKPAWELKTMEPDDSTKKHSKKYNEGGKINA